MGFLRVCGWMCVWALLVWVLGSGSVFGAGETEVKGVGFAAPRKPQETAAPAPEFTDPEGAHDPEAGVIFSSLSFYDLKHGKRDEDKQRWRDTDFIHWIVSGATLKAWGQVHDGHAAELTLATSDAWGNERIDARIESSEGAHGVIRAENEIGFSYSYLIIGNRIGHAEVQLLGTVYDVKGRPHVFSLVDKRNQNTKETTDKTTGLSIHENVSTSAGTTSTLSLALSGLSGSLGSQLAGAIGLGGELQHEVSVEIERELATAGGDAGATQPFVVTDRVAGPTPISRQFEVFSDGSVMLAAQAAPGGEAGDSEVIVQLRSFKITNTLRVWKSVSPDTLEPEDVEPPPADPGPGPTTPGGSGGGSGGPSGSGAQVPPVFADLDDLRTTRNTDRVPLLEEPGLHATVGVLDPFGLDGERGSLPGAVAIRLDAPAPSALTFSVRVEPAGGLFLQSADDLVLEEGERWTTRSIHGREPGAAILVLQPIDAAGTPLGDPIEIAVEVASVAQRAETEIWATVGNRGWQPGSGSSVRGLCGTAIGPLRIGRTGFDGFDETATTLGLRSEDPDGILEPLPASISIPAGETAIELPLALRDEQGAARIFIAHGDREIAVEVTSVAQSWAAPVPLRIPVGCVAPLAVRLSERERDLRPLSLSVAGSAVALETDSPERTLSAGRRLAVFPLRGLVPGETTVTVTSPGLTPLEVQVEVISRRIRFEEGRLIVTGIDAAAEGVIALVVPDGMIIAAAPGPDGSEEWLESAGIGSRCLTLAFRPSPDMPTELSLDLTFDGAPLDGGPIQLVVLDALRGAPERSVHSVRMRLD